VNTVSIGSTAANISLASLPLGIPVEALGRCIATSSASPPTYVLMSTPLPAGSSTLPPAAFPTAPGYAMKLGLGTAAPTGTSFPYRTYTDASADITVQANQTATLNCMTDGWVLKTAP
jgi:hypothetical protein